MLFYLDGAGMLAFLVSGMMVEGAEGTRTCSDDCAFWVVIVPCPIDC
jgi:hypothetical protein